MKEFKVNEYISLKLVSGKLDPVVRIYINNQLANGDYLRTRSLEEYCNVLKTWVDNNYDMSTISDEDIDVFFPLLRILYEAGELKAQQMFKKEITKTIKNAEYSDYAYIILFSEDLISSLSNKELIEGILHPEEALTLFEIQKHTTNSYHLVIEFEPNDEVRRRVHPDRYYFSTYKGHIIELDLELNRFNSIFPESIFNLKKLTKLHLFLYDISEVKFSTDKMLESLERFYIYEFQEVKSPPLYDFFPNLFDIRRIKCYW